MSVRECKLCNWFGNAVADLQSIILDLEFIRGMWVTVDYFNDLGGWELLPKSFKSVKSSRPIVENNRPIVEYKFITWRDTVDWTI